MPVVQLKRNNSVEMKIYAKAMKQEQKKHLHLGWIDHASKETMFSEMMPSTQETTEFIINNLKRFSPAI